MGGPSAAWAAPRRQSVSAGPAPPLTDPTDSCDGDRLTSAVVGGGLGAAAAGTDSLDETRAGGDWSDVDLSTCTLWLFPAPSRATSQGEVRGDFSGLSCLQMSLTRVRGPEREGGGYSALSSVALRLPDEGARASDEGTRASPRLPDDAARDSPSPRESWPCSSLPPPLVGAPAPCALGKGASDLAPFIDAPSARGGLCAAPAPAPAPAACAGRATLADGEGSTSTSSRSAGCSSGDDADPGPTTLPSGQPPALPPSSPDAPWLASSSLDPVCPAIPSASIAACCSLSAACRLAAASSSSSLASVAASCAAACSSDRDILATSPLPSEPRTMGEPSAFLAYFDRPQELFTRLLS
mmetsp:Transcript_10200/g.29263  ORF Transcript_10200/g.29263 Transcript_10200/m.29263 type:complete len:354 (+) Transcript_10200:594-1655(+)